MDFIVLLHLEITIDLSIQTLYRSYICCWKGKVILLAMVEKELPEDIIETILTRLPVRSLIKFRSVSKRWRSIISDPRFAKKHRRLASEQKNLRSRLLFSTASQLVSLDLEETRWSVGDVVKPSINKQLTYRELGCRVKLVGSCNGLVCVAYNVTTLLIWNPSTGFLHKLPELRLPRECVVTYFGFGYLSATDDYKVVVGTFYLKDSDYVKEVEIFSLRAQIWKRIESPVAFPMRRDGVLLNETLHWLGWIRIGILNGDKPALFAFDLAKEEFRKMSLPSAVKANICMYGPYEYRLGVSCDGCLYVMRYVLASRVCAIANFWVMREYGARDSWTKLFKFKTSNKHKRIKSLEPVLLMETGAAVVKSSKRKIELVRIDRNEQGKVRKRSSTVVARYMVGSLEKYNMIQYEVGLQWLDDCHDGVEEHKVKRLKTQHKAEAEEDLTALSEHSTAG